MLTEKVLLYPLPHKIKGFICADVEGEEVFILNSRLTNESNRDTMLHEICHKQHNDVYRCCCVNKVEYQRHQRVK